MSKSVGGIEYALHLIDIIWISSSLNVFRAWRSDKNDLVWNFIELAANCLTQAMAWCASWCGFELEFHPRKWRALFVFALPLSLAVWNGFSLFALLKGGWSYNSQVLSVIGIGVLSAFGWRGSYACSDFVTYKGFPLLADWWTWWSELHVYFTPFLHKAMNGKQNHR